MSELAKKLEEFLERGGATILPVTNPWEIARFKTVRGVCVIYRNANGNMRFSDPNAEEAYDAYRQGKAWFANEKATRIKRRTIREQLLARDGGNCFYCTLPFTSEDPETIEHFLAIAKGGTNHLDNLALAHESCNRAVGDLPIVKKIALRDRMRGEAAL